MTNISEKNCHAECNETMTKQSIALACAETYPEIFTANKVGHRKVWFYQVEYTWSYTFRQLLEGNSKNTDNAP